MDSAGGSRTRPQKTWRTAWRSIVKEAAKQAGDAAAEAAVKEGTAPAEARTRASEPYCLIGTVHIAGKFHQVCKDVGHVGGKAAGNVDNLKVNIRIVSAEVQPDSLVRRGATGCRNATTKDEVVNLRHPPPPFEAPRQASS